MTFFEYLTTDSSQKLTTDAGQKLVTDGDNPTVPVAFATTIVTPMVISTMVSARNSVKTAVGNAMVVTTTVQRGSADQ